MPQTLKRKDRILRSRDFRRAFRGMRLKRASLTVFASSRREEFSRLGLTVSKKVGNAVVRNLVKRRLRHLYRTMRDGLTSAYDVVIIAHPEAAETSFQSLRAQLSGVFSEVESRGPKHAPGGGGRPPRRSGPRG